MQEITKEFQLNEKAQIIVKKIDPDKFDDEIYVKLEKNLKREIKEGLSQVIIYFIPTKPITEKWIVWSLLDLQRKFTEVLFMPSNIFSDAELEDWFYYKNPMKVYRLA